MNTKKCGPKWGNPLPPPRQARGGANPCGSIRGTGRMAAGQGLDFNEKWDKGVSCRTKNRGQMGWIPL
ncbi:MAG: hypothetical protein JXQ65_07695 [Candidatus Marinimicrobia bacterium]|nr:hypothetical protein [Candidatus Neomarinimicrobiota bacterium]